MHLLLVAMPLFLSEALAMMYNLFSTLELPEMVQALGTQHSRVVLRVRRLHTF